MSDAPSNSRKKRSAIFIVIIASIAVHLLVGGVLAVIKITEVLQKTPEFESPPLEAVTPPPPPPPPPPTTTRTQKSMPRPQPLAAQNPQNLDIPKIEIERSDLNMQSGRGFGGGLGDIGGGVLDAMRNFKLFGADISAEGLGVVLDVSGSAHAYLDKAIEEIDKNFPGAPMILVVGCGMSDGKVKMGAHKGMVPGEPRVVPYDRRGSNEEYDSLGRSVPAQLEVFFRSLSRSEGKKAAADLREYFKKRNNLYILYGGDVVASNFAFEYLLEKNVDTIYWFADFADAIDKDEISRLGRELKRKRVKVIAHNFFGKPVREEVKAMVKRSGGQTIEVIPGKSK